MSISLTDLHAPGLWLVIIASFTLAGLVKGTLGMGLPTVAVGLLSLSMAPAQAAALLLLPSMVTNVWQLLSGPAFLPLLKRLAPMMIGILLGSVAGALGLKPGQAPWSTPALGLALIVYAALGLFAFQPKVNPTQERRWGAFVGLVTGIITAATGVFVIPAVPFLQALGLNKDDLVQALGLSFTVSTIGLATGLGSQGQVDGPILIASLLALVPALVGMWLGQRLRGRISAAAFRRGFLIGLLVLGLHLASSVVR